MLAAYAHTDKAGGWDTSLAEVFEETGAGQPLPTQPDGQPHALTERVRRWSRRSCQPCSASTTSGRA